MYGFDRKTIACNFIEILAIFIKVEEELNIYG